MSDAVEQAQAPEAPAEAQAPATVPEISERERELRARALAEVRAYGDPVLRSRASEVSEFGPELEREVSRMVSIMRDAMGVGLAATQLGVLRRLLVFQAGQAANPSALANPEIEWLSDELEIAEEGCLSLPGIGVDVERPLHARVRGLDVSGEPMLIEASGLEARVLQHEIDHLDGILILDRTVREQRKEAMRALREGEAYSPTQDAQDDESSLGERVEVASDGGEPRA